MTAAPTEAPEAEAVDPTDDGDDETTRWYEQSVLDHPAASILLVAMVLALPILVFGPGGKRWFYLDDWDFLAARNAGHLGDWFRPHNENPSTIPILIFRGLFHFFHLTTSWPYEVPVVLAHLCVVGLLYVIMRRSGVNQWIALGGSLVLLAFGSGWENIVWDFQIGFTGALAAGLGQLVVSQHDGPIDRRDGYALALGLVALLFSSVAVTTVVVVGVACLAKRGWKAALLQTAPLGVAYLIWSKLAHPSVSVNPFGLPTSTVVRRVAEWDQRTVGYLFGHLGSSTLAGVALFLLLVVGLWFSWTRLGLREVLRRQSMVLGMLVGVVVFTTLSGAGRWFLGVQNAASPRYLYIEAVMLLPALCVAATALVRTSRWLIPVVVVVGLIGVPGNLHQFSEQKPPPGPLAKAAQENLAAMASSPLIDKVPASDVPSPNMFPWVTAGWMRQAWRNGWLPRPKVGLVALGAVPEELGVHQSQDPHPAGTCQTVTKELVLHPPQGFRFWQQEAKPKAGQTQQTVDVSTLPPFTITPLDAAGRPISIPLGTTPSYGDLFTVRVPGLALALKPEPGYKHPLVICH